MIPLVAATVLLGALVQGTTGIGLALLVAPAVALLRPDLLPALVLLLMLPLNLYVLLRERVAVDWRGAGWIMLGRALGTVPGWAALVLLPPRWLDALVGAATLAAVAATLARPAFRPTPGNAALAGCITGVTETATSIGGPPLALLYQHQPGPVLRTTVAVCFLLGQAVSLAVLVGFHLCERFRPEVLSDVRGWGAKGELDLEKVRGSARGQIWKTGDRTWPKQWISP